MEVKTLKRFWKEEYLIRAISAIILASVFNMLARWGELSYNTLDFARSISLLYAFILIAICFEVLTILSMSLRHRHFDVYALSYASMTTLFLILLGDTSSSVALGILGLLLIIFYLAWPALCRAGRDISSRPYLMTLGGLMIPLILLIGFRLFSSTTVSAFVTQKALGINLMTQIILILFWGSAVGTLLFSWQSRRPLGKRRINWACLTAAAAAIVHIVLIGGILLFRYWTMRTSTYDFGLFAQMFTYMKETGLPLTTLERNGLLSHYAVHLSPVFYLMLPFYMIWPDPATLQILQPVIVISGLIPLMLLARHFKVPVGWQAITAVIYAFHPGLLGSSLYDLHENCFLAPLLLWVLYFLEKKSWLGGLISAALVLAVKEDAALYLLAIAIYAIVSRKNWKYGLVLASFSAAYFAFALILLARIGSGPMIGRFDNLIADPNLGLLSVPLTLMRNPGYLLSQVFTEQKLIYIVKMLLPVGFLPVLNRRINSWILLVPFLVMNLMSDYPYQYQLGFQYHYGTTVLLIYMMLTQVAWPLRVAAEPETTSKDAVVSHRYPGRRVLAFGVGTGLIASLLFGGILIQASSHYFKSYKLEQETLQTIAEALDTIPADASVQASNFFTPYLSGHLELYDIGSNLTSAAPFVTDFVALDLRNFNGVGYQAEIELLTSQGYTEVLNVENRIMILKRGG